MSDTIETLRRDVTNDPVLLEKFLMGGVNLEAFMAEAERDGYSVASDDVRDVQAEISAHGLARITTRVFDIRREEIVELSIDEVSLVAGGLYASQRPSPAVVFLIGVAVFAGVVAVAATFVLIAI